MYYVRTLCFHGSCYKLLILLCTLAQVTFQHRLTIYGQHHKKAYSDEKEPKKREREWERNEEVGRENNEIINGNLKTKTK